VGKPEGKRPLGRPRHRWEDNIKMDLQELGWCVNFIDLPQDRERWRTLLKTVMNFLVPSDAGNFLTNWGPVSLSGRCNHVVS
jgi:hypothetical protein